MIESKSQLRSEKVEKIRKLAETEIDRFVETSSEIFLNKECKWMNMNYVENPVRQDCEKEKNPKDDLLEKKSNLEDFLTKEHKVIEKELNKLQTENDKLVTNINNLTNSLFSTTS